MEELVNEINDLILTETKLNVKMKWKTYREEHIHLKELGDEIIEVVSETEPKDDSNSFESLKKEFELTRKLVKGSLEVHPVKYFGAIEIGVQQFRHIENGKEEIGTFRFVMIWPEKDDQWKRSGVINYAH